MKRNLLGLVKIFKIQGFKTFEEAFLLGYIVAHGGEKHLLNQVTEDLKLLNHNAKFWLPQIEDIHKIRVKVADKELKEAIETLKKLLENRKQPIPAWLQSEVSV